jgi:pullulanase
LSQGVPFIYAGEEMMRNKQGVHNSYKSPDSINQLNWADLGTHRDVFLYYRELIAIRKAHKAFRMGDAEQVRKHLHFLKSPSCVIAFILDGKAVGDSWSEIVCIMNSNRTPQTVTIPEGTYTVVCRDGMACADGLGKLNGGIVTVAPQQALILYRGENTKN